jgi:biotin carboxyl carrier protein
MTDVRAEITANVWKVQVEVGAAVAEGDELAILESMKMEIPVESPVAGTVTAVHVAPDSQVKEGDLICTVDPDGEA